MSNFKRFESFREFVKSNNVQVAETDKGKMVLMVDGEFVATISKDLQGSTAAETVQNLRSVNLSVGIPTKSVQEDGRPNRPCVFENKSTWELVDL